MKLFILFNLLLSISVQAGGISLAKLEQSEIKQDIAMIHLDEAINNVVECPNKKNLTFVDMMQDPEVLKKYPNAKDYQYVQLRNTVFKECGDQAFEMIMDGKFNGEPYLANKAICPKKLLLAVLGAYPDSATGAALLDGYTSELKVFMKANKCKFNKKKLKKLFDDQLIEEVNIIVNNLDDDLEIKIEQSCETELNEQRSTLE